MRAPHPPAVRTHTTPSALTFVGGINPRPRAGSERKDPDGRRQGSPEFSSHVCRLEAGDFPAGRARRLMPLHPGGKSVRE